MFCNRFGAVGGARIGEQKMANEKRLIDAKAFELRVSQKKMQEVFPNWKELPKEVQDAVCKHGQYLHMLLETQPTVDAVEVVHGRWIARKICVGSTIFKCSECSRDVEVTNDYFGKPSNHVAKHYPYCRCGAKMDGERKDNGSNI